MEDRDWKEARFCKRHGYIRCKCPEEMGLSLTDLKELEAEVEKLKGGSDE